MSRGRATTPRSTPCANARSATCWPRSCSRRARRCCWPGTSSAAPRAGNNNAYCQDNAISWVDWEGIGDAGTALATFTRKLIALRHRFPLLHRNRFLTGAFDADFGVHDVSWLTPSGQPKETEHWEDPRAKCFGMLLDGRAQATGIHKPAGDSTLLLIVNAHHDAVEFALPEPPAGRHWLLLLDTNRPALHEPEDFPLGHTYLVTGRSLLLLLLQLDEGGAVSRNAARAALLAGTVPPPLPGLPQPG